MARSFVIYVTALICAVMFYLVYSLWFSWYLLVLVLLILPFDLLVSLPGMLSKQVSLSSPRLLAQDGEGYISVIVKARSHFIGGNIKVLLSEITEDGHSSHKIHCSGRGGRTQMSIATSACGLVQFELRRVRAASLLGLFSIPIKTSGRVSTLILPEAVMPPSSAILPQNEARVPKPGGGFAEDHDLRPYRQGDPMNSVHWKLSAKHDSLIIREALVAPPHSRLVKCAKWSSPRERELVLGRLRWVSDYLLQQELAHYVQLGKSGAIAEVAHEGDLVKYLYHELGGEGRGLGATTIPARFSWVFSVDAKEIEV